MWHWRACCHTSRERRASAAQSSMGLYAKVPSAGAGATRCALLGHTQLSTTTSVLSVRRPDAASKLLRCSGAAVTSSAWALARRGRCGPCIALMTKKVEEGRRRVCIFMHWRASSAPRRALSFLLALRQGFPVKPIANESELVSLTLQDEMNHIIIIPPSNPRDLTSRFAPHTCSGQST